MNRSSTWLLRGCAAAGPLFVATALAEGRTRPDYRPQRHPVSSLAIGPRGWVQSANFLLTGTLYAAGAVGLWRSDPRTRTVSILVAAAGVGLLGAGTFRTDPVSGYPPGTPDQLTSRTTSGLLHDLLSVPTFLGLPAAAAVEAVSAVRSRDLNWSLYCATSALTEVVSFLVASAGFAQRRRFVDRAGLAQRAFVVTGFGWLTALCLRRLRADPGRV